MNEMLYKPLQFMQALLCPYGDIETLTTFTQKWDLKIIIKPYKFWQITLKIDLQIFLE